MRNSRTTIEEEDEDPKDLINDLEWLPNDSKHYIEDPSDYKDHRNEEEFSITYQNGEADLICTNPILLVYIKGEINELPNEDEDSIWINAKTLASQTLAQKYDIEPD
jgi:hypothetical protein